MNLNINKREFFYVVAIIIMMFLNYYSHNKMNEVSKKFNNYELAISALNDSIKHTVKKGLDVYSKTAPEIDINDLVNSEYFKTLSEEQKKYYTELKNIKGLIASSKAELEKQGTLLDQILAGQNPGTISNDSISFKLGQILNFAETDTTKKLQWKSNITLDKNIKFKFDYDYKFEINTSYERMKDKTIVVKYTINDPDLKVNNIQNYIIPIEQRRTKVGKWYDKNKKTILTTTGGVLFVGGGIFGYLLAK